MIATIVIQFQPHMFKIGQASFWLSVTSEGWLNLATLSQGKQLTDPSQIISWKRLDHHFLLNSTAGTYCGSFRFRRLSSNIIGINRFYNILHTHIYIYIYIHIHIYIYIWSRLPPARSHPPNGMGLQVAPPIPFYLQAIGSISEVQPRIC